jgi:X-Pro dipeptidyl-peptidase
VAAEGGGTIAAFPEVHVRRVLLLVLALSLCLGALAPGAVADEHIKTTKGISEPIYTQTITEEYRVPTKHGTIYGVVIRPVVPEGVKVPVILTYTPYGVLSRQHNLTAGNDGTGNYYVPRGYARAQFDLVGTRESGGCTDFGGIGERETGAAVVDFLGSREWSNGRVGMIGGSYDGTTQIAAAIEQPKHLTTIVPQVAIDRWWDYAYQGAIRRYSGYGTPLAFDYAFGITPSTDPRNPTHAAEVAQARVNPCRRVQHQLRGYGYDPMYDAFWDERDYREQAHKVKASVLIEGGWLDRNVSVVGSTGFWSALPDDHPKKMIMGQWGHGAPSGQQVSDWAGVRHAWFDYWLLGYDGTNGKPDTGVMDLPRVDSAISSSERIQADHWPPAGMEEVTLALRGAAAEDGLRLATADARWTTDDPRMDSTRMRACDGAACALWVGDALEESLRLAGRGSVDLTLRTDALDAYTMALETQIAVVLFSQAPNGTRTQLTDGMLNSRNRRSLRSSEDLPAGNEWTISVPLRDFDRRVPEGHRLGVAIASHNGTEAFLPDDALPVVNEVLVSDGDVLRSSLVLPVAEGTVPGTVAAPGSPEPAGSLLRLGDAVPALRR